MKHRHYIAGLIATGLLVASVQAAQPVTIDLQAGLQPGVVPQTTEDGKDTGWKRNVKEGNVGEHFWSFRYEVPTDEPPFLNLIGHGWNNIPPFMVTRDLWVDGQITSATSWELSGRIRFQHAPENTLVVKLNDEDGQRIFDITRLTVRGYGPEAQPHIQKFQATFRFNGQAIAEYGQDEAGYQKLLADSGKWVAFSIKPVTEGGETFLRLTYGDKTIDAPIGEGSIKTPRYLQFGYLSYIDRIANGALQTRNVKFTYTKGE